MHLINLSYKKRRLIFAYIIIALAMVFLSSCDITQLRDSKDQKQYQYRETPYSQHIQAPQTPQITRNPDQLGGVALATQRVRPSVVGISTYHVQQGSYGMESQSVEGVGSGFIVSSDGYILTNDHVAVSLDAEIWVILHNGDELEGKVLWTDPTLDLAMIKVDATGLPAAELGDSSQLIVGELAIAIGTPLGLQFQHTTTAGIVSALDRTVEVGTERGQNFMEDLIQTDASINPGNSGGPLVNIDGQIIGINTVKVVSAEGIGFAIPINVAKPVIQHFFEEGEFVTPYIGVVGYDKDIAHYYKQTDSLVEGVYVVSLDPQGPAYKSGIKMNDIITRVADMPVTKMLELRTAVYTHHVGDVVKLIVIRDRKEMEIEMTLEQNPVLTVK
ncbi:MAG: PDZ domain-containing protein [Clostridiales bacterium]|nr:PDZ domain-containing protein [Clostridiales bacterium]